MPDLWWRASRVQHFRCILLVVYHGEDPFHQEEILGGERPSAIECGR